MKQSKKESLVEQVLNVGSGWVVSLLVWAFLISPLYNIETSLAENMGITIIFTFISIVRGYMWRRYFNKRLENKSL